MISSAFPAMPQHYNHGPIPDPKRLRVSNFRNSKWAGKLCVVGSMIHPSLVLEVWSTLVATP